MTDEMLKTVTEFLDIDECFAREHSRYIPEIDAYRFGEPIRGGVSIIIKSNGEKLVAGSSVPPPEHIQAFKDGKRN